LFGDKKTNIGFIKRIDLSEFSGEFLVSNFCHFKCLIKSLNAIVTARHSHDFKEHLIQIVMSILNQCCDITWH
jgi:hypothetical protein